MRFPRRFAFAVCDVESLTTHTQPHDAWVVRYRGSRERLLIPLSLLFALGGLVPTFSTPKDRDLATWIGTASGKHFMQGNWGWYALILLLFVVNIVGEELLFRGVLLPRMRRSFGRRDWLANAILFTAYHLHEPWLMPGTFVCDTFAYVYPSRRYQSTWIGIIVHGGQTLFFGALLLALVLR